MNLKQLEYLVAIIEARSFTHAAAQLGVVQPAIGQQIKKLEDELDVKLLHRHSRGVVPTEAGLLLLDHARKILADVDEARTRLQDFGQGLTGRVTLGLTTMLSGVLAGELFQRLTAEAPDLQVSLVEEMSSVLTEWVAGDRLQLALAFNVASLPGLRWEPVLQECLYFVESSELGKSNGGDISFAEVMKHRLMVPALPHSIRTLVEDASRDQNLNLDVLYDVQSVATVRELVSQKIAATVMPYGAVRREVEAGTLIAKRVVNPEVKRDLFFIHSDKKPFSKVEIYLKNLLWSLIEEKMVVFDNWSPIVDRARSIEAAERRQPIRAKGTATG